MMSTPVFVDPESFTQADGAQSFRVPVPLLEDPYEAIRTARMAVRVPPAMSSYESSPSMSPLDLPSRKRYRGTSELVEDSEEEDDEEDEEIEESMDSDRLSESHGMDDESRGLDDEGHSIESDGLDLEEEEEAVPRGQQQTTPVMRTAVSAPLGLGYGALRRRELALEEDDVYNTFEVRQDSRSTSESERPERVSTSRQPTLTTWTDPKDGMVYIDVPTYPTPAPHVQTPPSPEWMSGSLLISPSPSIVPLPVSSPMFRCMRGLIGDHVVRLEELSPALFERYVRDIGELFMRSGAVRDEIFSQRYRFRSLEYEQERVAVTFGAIWRPVLALESWAGQTNAQRAALWHAINDIQGENQDLQLQLVEERRARLELAEVVDSMRRWHEPRGGT
ncbi:hypothetical protein Tco_1366394 [Tanacetum coccineum]